MSLHHRSTSTDIYAHTVRTDTAASKLMILSEEAVLRLFTAHLQIRATRFDLDPDALEAAAHELNDLATEARRKRMKG